MNVVYVCSVIVKYSLFSWKFLEPITICYIGLISFVYNISEIAHDYIIQCKSKLHVC